MTEEIKQINIAFNQALKANDVYNIIVNRRSSERGDVLETVSTLIAIYLDERGNISNDHAFLNFLEPIVRGQISKHFSSCFFDTTEVFFDEAQRIASSNDTLQHLESKLQFKENKLTDFTNQIFDQFDSTFNSLKIGGIGSILLNNIGVFHFCKTSNQEMSCNESDYNTLFSIIEPTTFPLKVFVKKKDEEWTWFLSDFFKNDIAYCSDNSCPCNQNIIPKNEGFIVIDKVGNNRFNAVITCETGARVRKIDLKSAHNNALGWWKNGRVPFRITEINKNEQKTPYYSSISDKKQNQIKNKYLDLKLKMLNFLSLEKKTPNKAQESEKVESYSNPKNNTSNTPKYKQCDDCGAWHNAAFRRCAPCNNFRASNDR